VVNGEGDEIAFWDSGGISPDREVLVCIRPAMSTIPSSKLLIISTPYNQSGTLYESHREHFGKDDDHVLVWVAETWVMNPTISEDLIQRELERIQKQPRPSGWQDSAMISKRILA
jgi:hypothetical protein